MPDPNPRREAKSQQLSAEELKETLHSLYRMLMTEDIQGVLSHCAEDIILTYESFTFKEKEGVRRWIGEFMIMFPMMRIIELNLTVRGNTVTHMFIIDFTMISGRKGMLHVEAKFDFRGRKIQHIRMIPRLGFLILSEKEERHGLGYSVQMRSLKL